MGYFLLILLVLRFSGTNSQNVEQFICGKLGRIDNPNDDTCNSFYVCSTTRQGNLIQTENNCPEGSVFVPEKEICSNDNICSKESTSSNKVIGMEKQGHIHYHCENEDPTEHECTKSGKYADLRGPTCNKYYSCGLLRNGSYVTREFVCPHGTLFDPNLQNCHRHYKCPCVNINGINTLLKLSGALAKPLISQMNTPDIEFCVPPENEFVCNKTGRFPDRRDMSCNTYYLCEMDKLGNLKKTNYRCPNCLSFDPNLAKCTNRYNCPCTSTETPETTTPISTRRSSTNECIYDPDIEPFECTTTGRFRDKNDPECVSYFLCSDLENGTLIKTPNICSMNSWFNPEIQKCSTNYSCPCKQISTRSTEFITSQADTSIHVVETTSSNMYSISTIEDFSKISEEETITSSSPKSYSTDDKTVTTNNEVMSTLSSMHPNNTTNSDFKTSPFTENNNQCVVPSPSDPFACMVRGRFSDMQDPTCSSYFLCSSLRNGTMIKTSYRCPINSWFDPTLKRCSILYVCPCSGSSVERNTSSMSSISTIDASVRTTDGQIISFSTKDGQMSPKSTNTEGITNTTGNEETNTSISDQLYNTTIIVDITTSANRETTNKCVVFSASNSFMCTARGRFADVQDLTCSSYFLCSALRDGTLIKTPYRCPQNSWFDPSLNRCSTLYICHCSKSSVTSDLSSTTSISTVEPSTKTSEGETIEYLTTESQTSSNSDTTQDDTISTNNEENRTWSSIQANNSTIFVVTTTGATTKKINDCVVSSSSSIFTCTARGRFADMQDLTCSSYFLCSALRNGTLIKTPYRCPKNSWFDPSLNRCSILYICPCGESSVTSDSSSTMSIFTVIPSTKISERETIEYSTTDSQTSSKSHSTRDETISTDNEEANTISSVQANNTTIFMGTKTSATTEYINGCIVPSSSSAFTCTARGRFADMQDLTCSSYFLCSALRNGTLIKTPYRCPQNSWFDPSLNRCSILYICPCSKSSVTSDLSSTTLISTVEPSMKTSERKTIEYSTTDSQTSSKSHSTQDETISTHNEKANTMSSAKANNTTNFMGTTTSATNEYISDCIFPSSSIPFTCTARGRFADMQDLTCSSYFLCSALRNGTLIKTPYRCPKNSWFDPSLNRCSTLYICPCGGSSVTSDSSSTMSIFTVIPSTKTSERETIEYSTIDSQTSSKSHSTRDETISTDNEEANTISSVQANKTTTFMGSTTSATTEYINDCIVPSSSIPFTCTARGRFVDMQDLTCSSYFLCSALRNGTLIKTPYRCPQNSWFDPSLNRCSILYICPCSKSSVTSDLSSTTLISTVEPSMKTSERKTIEYSTTESQTSSKSHSTHDETISTDNEEAITISSVQANNTTNFMGTTTSATTEYINDCIVPSSSIPFTCTARGRFAEMQDLTCSSYFLCSALRNGTLIKTPYRCPKNSWFDPSLNICSTLYICPCGGSSVTSDSSSTMSIFTVIPSTKTSESETIEYSTTDSQTSSKSHSTRDETISTDNEEANTISSVPANKTTIFMGSSTSATTEYINDCIVPSSSIPFTCTARGRFVDMQDLTCSSYFLCSALRNGTLIKTPYRCPQNSWFDPSLNRCSILYICPCSKSSATSDLSSTTSVSTVEPSTKTSERKTIDYSTTDSQTSSKSHSTQDETISTDNEEANTISSVQANNTTIFMGTTTSATSEYIKDCIVPSSSIPFTCTARGRFADMQDLTCSSYFLCSAIRNGTLIKTPYRCPKNSWFDPSLNRCSTLYICPCGGSSVTSDSSSTMSIFTVIPSAKTSERETIEYSTTDSQTSSKSHSTRDETISTDNEEANTISSVQANNSTIFMGTTTSATTEYINGCIVPSSSIPFTCTARGRFVDMQDLTCSSYFLCSALRNGTLIKTPYRCPQNSWFDPSLNRCSILYICPCSKSSATSDLRSTTSISTLEPSTKTSERKTIEYSTTDSQTSSKSHSTQDETISTGHEEANTISPVQANNTTIFMGTTTSATTEYINGCIVPSSSIPFTCTARGRFVDMQDLTCSSYFLCSALRNGTLIKTPYRCPQNSWFDPSLNICSILYICPCSKSSVTSDLSSTTLISTVEPSTKTSERKTIEYSTTDSQTSSKSHSTQDETISTGHEEANTISPVQANNTTIFMGTTTSATTEYINGCIVPSSSIPFTCTARGRFVDMQDLTCSSYFLCSALRNGTLIKTPYRCPQNSWFDPSLNRCSILYICPCSKSSVTSDLSSTTLISTVEPSMKTSERKTIEYSTTDSQTSSKSHSTQDETISTHNEKANTMSSAKANNTTIFMGTTTSATNEYISDCIFPSSSIPFTCTARGRFADMQDLTCSSYFLCSALRNGTLIKTPYRCPKNSWFDPSLNRCSTLYICPCGGSSVTSDSSSTMSIFTVIPSTKTSERETIEYSTIDSQTSSKSHSTRDETISTDNEEANTISSVQANKTTTFMGSTTSATTEYINDCIVPSSSIPFTCTARGRFVDMQDLTCSSYFLCSALRNGTLIKTPYRCPQNSWFDPSLNRCSILYICPCSKSSATSDLSSTTSVSTVEPSTKTSERKTIDYSTTDSQTSSKSHSTQDETISTDNEEANTISSVQANNTTIFMGTTTSATSEYIKDCIVPSSSIPFTCTARGRFADMQDLTCSSYFLCSAIRNGTLIKTPYRCPKNSWFDPSLNRCSTLYICPCGGSSVTSDSSSTMSIFTVIPSAKTSERETIEYSTTDSQTSSKSHSTRDETISTDNEEANTISSVQANNSTIFMGTTTSATTEYINGCIVPSSSIPFTCTARGRFVDMQDLTCSSYFLCSALRNGTLIKTPYRCPQNSWFDPSLNRCSILYICPCSKSSATSDLRSTTSISTLEPSTKTSERKTIEYSTTDSQTSSKSHSTQDETISTGHEEANTISPVQANNTTIFMGTTTSATTEYINGCIVPSSSIPFTCTARGRFVDMQDLTCSSYFLCSALRNGTLIKTPYRCPQNSWFDPSLNICSILYICPCSKSSVTSDLSSTTLISTVEPSTKTSERKTIEYSTTDSQTSSKSHSTQDETISTGHEEANTISPVQANNTTIFMGTTTSATTEYINGCIVPSSSIPFTCTARGRFVDMQDLTCSSYFLCSALRNGTLIKTPYRCPQNSWFDPSLNRCSILYICPCSKSSVTSDLSSTTLISTVEPSMKTSERKTIEYSTTDSQTSSKSHSTQDETISTHNEKANTMSSAKANNTTIFMGTTTSATNEYISDCIFPSSSIPFTCTARGRFADMQDLTCSSYFLCSALRNGTLIKTPYRCPKNSWFDPSLNRCSTLYICPCGGSSVTSDSSSTMSIFTVIPSTKTSERETIEYSTIDSQTSSKSHSTRDETISTDNEEANTISSVQANKTTTFMGSTTSATTEYINDCIVPSSSIPFTCTARGRFVDMQDLTCSSYFLCSALRNGTLIKTPYRCPQNSWFDPFLNRCSILYICPCSKSSATSDLSSTTSISTVEPSTKTSERKIIEYSTTDSRTSSKSHSTQDETISTDNEEAIKISSVQANNTTNFMGTTTSATTEYINDCIVPSSSIPFTCTARGRFADMKDLTCSSYFLCSALRNGTLIKTPYRCPKNSWFDPSLNRCSTLYICPCGGSSVTSDSISTLSIFTVIPSTKTSERETIEYSTTDSQTSSNSHSTRDETISTDNEEANTISSVQANNTTIFMGTTTRATTEYINGCIVPSSSSPFTCTARGRFVDMQDLTCSSYFLCSALRNGTLIKTPYRCPQNSWFDPSLNRCSILYICPCSKSSVTSDLSSTTLISTVEPSMKTSERKTIEYSTTESQTSSKSHSTHDETISTDNEKANTMSSAKANNTTIFMGTTTSATKEYISDCIFPSSSIPFTCTARGRFADMQDLTCSSYFLCSALRNGTLIKTPYRCPKNSWFDPSLNRCSTLYICPCGGSSVASDSSSTMSIFTVIPSTKTTERETIEYSTTDGRTSSKSHSTQDETISTDNEEAITISSVQANNTTNFMGTTTSATTEYINDCIVPSSSIPFTCTARGRFAEMQDLTCSSYFLCSALRNGTLIKIPYRCPKNSWFDPSLNICSTLYICPCGGSSVTSDSSSTMSIFTVIPSTKTSESETIEYSTTVSQTSSKSHSTRDETISTDNEEANTISSVQANKTTIFMGSSTSVTTEYINGCIVPSSSTPFTCTARGRFVDMQDLTCSSYFLCSALRNGTLIKTPYRCPQNSWFDPSLNICSILYICPCSKSSVTSDLSSTTLISTVELSTKTSERKTIEYSTTDSQTSSKSHSTQDETISTGHEEANTISPVQANNTTIFMGTTTSATTEYINGCIVPSSSIPFTCTARGRFVDMQDLTCSSYFLCSALRNGTLIKTPYRCPQNSWFDPSLNICSILYICPCSKSSVTSDLSSTTLISTVEPSTKTSERKTIEYSTTDSQTSSKSHSTQDETISTDNEKANTMSSAKANNMTIFMGTTTSATKEYINDCIVPSSSIPFTCTARGRFADMQDLTCSSYFLCSALRNGTLIKTPYRCPKNSWFDPSLNRCSILYICPCSKSSVTSDSSSAMSIYTVIPSTKTSERETVEYSTTDSQTSSKSHSTQDETISTDNEEANKMSSVQANNTTIFMGTTTSATTEYINVCIVPSSSIPFTCTARGRFVDTQDLTCSSYFLCSALRNGTLIKTPYRCPQNSWFDPSLNRCSILHICPCSKSSVTSDSSTTTSISTVEASTKTSEKETMEYLRTDSRTSSNGITTQDDTISTNNEENSTLSSVQANNSTIFMVTTTGATTEIINNCVVPFSSSPFTCNARGRFADMQDLTCSSYFLCSALRNGTLIKTPYRCPKNSWFDPSLNRCSILYRCPCSGSSVTSNSSSTISISTVEDSTKFSERETVRFSTTNSRTNPFTSVIGQITISTENEEMSTSSSSDPKDTSIVELSTSTSTKTINECVGFSISETFTCNIRGRFANKDDLSCSSYFLCSALRNGTLLKTPYQCPRNSWYDPVLRICSTLYVCPCLNSSMRGDSISTSPISTGNGSSKPSEGETLEYSTADSYTNSNRYITDDKAISRHKEEIDISGSAISTVYGHTNTLNRKLTKYSLDLKSNFKSHIIENISLPIGNRRLTNFSESLTNSILQSTYSKTPSESFNLCVITSQSKPFRCITSGRFVNRTDLTCSSYFHCSVLGDGKVVQAQFRCMDGLKFDPIIQECSSRYQCPCKSAMIPKIQISTTNSTSSSGLCNTIQEHFICSSEGRFNNPSDLSCSTYYLCSPSGNGTILQIQYSCLEGTKFDPVSLQCSEDFKCPCSITETPQDHTDSSVDCRIPTEDFVCTAAGRFPDRRDVSCCNYFLCSETTNSSFTKTAYSCPLGETFNPELQKCSHYYKCPCTRREAFPSDQITRLSKSKIVSTTSDVFSTEASTIKVTKGKTLLAPLSECVPLQSPLSDFMCTTEGKFLNPQDSNCSSYVDCISNGINFVKNIVKCEENTKFDNTLQKCTSNAICQLCNEGDQNY